MSLTSMDVEPDGKTPEIPGRKELWVDTERHVLSISMMFTGQELSDALPETMKRRTALAEIFSRLGVSWSRLSSGVIELRHPNGEMIFRDPINRLKSVEKDPDANDGRYTVAFEVLLAPDGGIASVQNREATYYPLGIIILAWSENGQWKVRINPLAPFAEWSIGQQANETNGSRYVSGQNYPLEIPVPNNLHVSMTEAGMW